MAGRVAGLHLESTPGRSPAAPAWTDRPEDPAQPLTELAGGHFKYYFNLAWRPR